MSVRPAKTQISLGICPIWSESLLSTWRKLGSLATHWAHSKDSDQTGWKPRLIWVFPGRTAILLVLSCHGSLNLFMDMILLSLQLGWVHFQCKIILYLNWASSWDYGTFHPPLFHSSNIHAQPSSRAKCLIFGQTLCLLPYIMCANSEGCSRACSPEPSLVAYVISTIISWAGSGHLFRHWLKHPLQPLLWVYTVCQGAVFL